MCVHVSVIVYEFMCVLECVTVHVSVLVYRNVCDRECECMELRGVCVCIRVCRYM